MFSSEILLVDFDADFTKIDQFIALPKDRKFSSDEIKELYVLLVRLNSIMNDLAIKRRHVHFLDYHEKLPSETFYDDCHLTCERKTIKGNFVSSFIFKQIIESN